MLNRVLELVASQGWFDVSTAFEKTINLTQGACLWLMLTRKGACDTYVKFSDCASLGLEAQRCAEASRCYPTLAPRFIGHLHQDGLHVLVCRAVDHCGFDAGHLNRSGLGASALRDLNGYFTSMTAAQLPQELTPIQNVDLIDDFGAYFAANYLAPLARRWLCSDAIWFAMSLPNIPQHGDFVINNIGQVRGGGVVVFDWEDFGVSCLPGLDLFTLELSVAGDAAGLFYGRDRLFDPLQRFVRAACEAIQLESTDYHMLTPVYALVFRHLKRNYGPEVRQRMDLLLHDLSQ